MASAPGAPPSVPETTTGPPAQVAGTWAWTCCDDAYSGTMTLEQSGAQFTGTFYDANGTASGDLVGSVDGSNVRMTRTTPTSRQEYVLRVEDAGRALAGSFTGTRNTSVGTAFRAERQ